MLAIVRATLSAPRSFLSKSMSSLVPGYIIQGARWDYRNLEHVKGYNTHTSNVFKAEIVQRTNSSSNALKSPQWALIKEASSSDAISMENMNRECQVYDLPGVNTAKCFRQIYDVIDNRTIALEWLDTTLADVQYHPNARRTYSLIVAVLRAGLTSCILLERHKRVNTDHKPANILLSGIDTGHVTAKVGDLGLVVPVGSLFNAQPYAMRAPEVFLGQACTEPSQVWAVAALLLCWIKPGVLGTWKSPHPLLREAWCMAKIKRLFPDWNIPTSDEVGSHSLKAAVDSASYFSKELIDLRAISPFGEETQGVMPRELRDLLRSMFVANPVERPSASAVLASEEFRAFERLACE